MSRRSSQERSVTIGDTEILTVVREECSPAESSVNINFVKEKNCVKACKGNACYNNRCYNLNPEWSPKLGMKMDATQFAELLQQKETELKNAFNTELDAQVALMKEKFNYMLQNEQIRASYMLREAHRERQEKIAALQTQLECRNLAALMCVLSSERRKSKLEKLKIIEDFTNHINVLQSILREAQSLILNLSRGYKTAARVDYDWKQKMKKVLNEFQNFVHCFAGGEAVFNQYFFDIPALIQSTIPTDDDPNEDPCDEDEQKNKGKIEEEPPAPKPWYERLDSDCRPFVMFGDMADFKPPQRRAVLKEIKAAKTAPKKYKEYVFNEISLHATCSNVNTIKDVAVKQPQGHSWDVTSGAVAGVPVYSSSMRSEFNEGRRETTDSGESHLKDARGTVLMGSIIKMISDGNSQAAKPSLLAARDSMEIVSSTRMLKNQSKTEGKSVNIDEKNLKATKNNDEIVKIAQTSEDSSDTTTEDSIEEEVGSIKIAKDSLSVLHVPDQDATIAFEKVCPMEQCQRMRVDSFIHSLPPYMKASPFTHFENTFDDYEVCSPEQLKILMERIEHKKKRERHDLDAPEPDPMLDWVPPVEGVSTQTSDIAVDVDLPPCSCREPRPSVASSEIRVFNVNELIQAKQLIDHVTETCLHDSRIDFDRFLVIGQEDGQDGRRQSRQPDDRFYKIKMTLQQHPSLCDLFQANAR